MKQPERDRFGSFQERRRFFLIAAIVAVAIGLVLFIRWLRKNSFRFRGQRGFTLMEVMVGVIIIGLIGTGVIKGIDANARATRILDEQVQATNLVTAYLEGMRQMSYSDNASPYNSVNATITIPAQYSVAMNIAYSNDDITWSTTNSSGALKLQKITISVSRTNGKLVLSTCTFRTKR